MTYMTDIAEAIDGLNEWQRVVLASICAESISPVVARFAQAATRRAFHEALGAVWKSVHDARVAPRVVSARDVLNNLPESTCDDSNIPPYEVMVALGILSYVLDTVVGDDSARSSKDACTLAVNHVSGYDHVLAYGNEVRTIDPRNPTSPGQLKSLQIQLQLRSSEVMRNGAQLSSRLIEQLRSSAAQVASELDRALPIYAAKRGWVG